MSGRAPREAVMRTGTGRGRAPVEGNKLVTSATTEVATAPDAEDHPGRPDAMAERFRALLSSSGVLVWDAPPDGTVRDLSLWCAYTGQTHEQALGWGWLGALHPDDRTRAKEVWERA